MTVWTVVRFNCNGYKDNDATGLFSMRVLNFNNANR